MKVKYIALLALVVGLSSCFPDSIDLPQSQENYSAGFFAGLWHGLIMPISFILSLLNDGVAVYQANNVGGWYDLGYLLGLSSSLGGGGFFGSKAKRRS